jgi:hypothetical protein
LGADKVEREPVPPGWRSLTKYLGCYHRASGAVVRRDQGKWLVLYRSRVVAEFTDVGAGRDYVEALVSVNPVPWPQGVPFVRPADRLIKLGDERQAHFRYAA